MSKWKPFCFSFGWDFKFQEENNSEKVLPYSTWRWNAAYIRLAKETAKMKTAFQALNTHPSTNTLRIKKLKEIPFFFLDKAVKLLWHFFPPSFHSKCHKSKYGTSILTEFTKRGFNLTILRQWYICSRVREKHAGVWEISERRGLGSHHIHPYKICVFYKPELCQMRKS